MDEPLEKDSAEPDFMPRLRRLFAGGLPDRLARMQRGLDGVAADVAAGRPPSTGDLEELFLAAHSLKGTAPGFGAVDLGHDAGSLSALAEAWGRGRSPQLGDISRARSLLQRVDAGCREVAAQLVVEPRRPRDA